MIRTMNIDDYDEVYKLWNSICGMGIRSIDDSREGIERFIKRNPTTSIVDEEDGKVVGCILCGHDGRTGCLYHVCVDKAYRKLGIGKKMTLAALNALKLEHISKVTLIAFADNEGGNAFWRELGFTMREDVNSYEYILNKNNVTNFVQMQIK